MERYVLLIYWQKQAENYREQPEPPLLPPGPADVKDFYTHLKERCIPHTDTFPACSLAGEPGTRKWFFAIQATCGFSQYASPDWEDLCPSCSLDDSEEPPQSTIDECICALQSPEDDEDERDSVSQTSLFEEAAESIHQLSDKLPAPDVPKLKDCVLAVGAMKHLKEWHAAKITIVTKERRGWQKISNYLSANVITPEGLPSALDPQELWRGSLEISERKFSSEVEFEDFCLRSVRDVSSQSSSLKLSEELKNQHHKNHKSFLPEVFHYYGSSLEFIQMVSLSELPPYFISDCAFELCLTRNSLQGRSKLMLGQLCSLNDKVGAIFMLSCNVCNLPLPPALQRSSKKWRDYMSKKPKEIKAPGMELKGEYCTYYFLIQGKDNEVCRATMLHSASQINGAASLVLLHRRLRDKPSTEESNFTALMTLPHFHGDHLLKREKCLAQAQALVVNEYLQRKEAGQQQTPVNVNSLKALLKLTRESVLKTFESKLTSSVCESTLQRSPPTGSTASTLFHMNSSEWPERNVLQNLENFEKIKQRIRASILSSSSDQLLGRKDSQKEGVTLLDAKELLKYFTPEGAAIGELQPLQVQRGDNAFQLTPELTPRKLRALPFRKASECHYHGLEYCLDNRKALDRDVSFSELQSRLIRYETQTTCTRECCPIPFALSPLPSPAVLSEPGSVPDGESLQGADLLRLKRRSRDLDGLIASKRLAKSESSDSLLSHSSENSGPNVTTVSRTRSERVAPMPSSVRPTSRDRGTSLGSKQTQPKQNAIPENDGKESRSQKHNRMLREVVCKTLLKHGIQEGHPCYTACNQRLFDISKFFLKDLKTSRGLHDEMKKAASNNVKQVIQWELDKLKKK
ncbi:mdm2-binding protein isoform X2 [Hyla sarda]|uniref:mdm2-binding protein isoform X2 n=1 Tax=Hyla sarda TaxID=327740 RepID=UPI0024C42128|nr:mdm2-binding protein isoform X2 [Hyla sarda]